MSAQWYDAEGGVVPRAWNKTGRPGRGSSAGRRARVGPVLLWLAVVLVVLARVACFSAERAPGPASAASARQVDVR